MPIHLNIADLAKFWIGSGRLEKYTCCSDRSAIRQRQSDFSTSPCSCSGVVEPVRPSWALLLSSVCQRPSCDWQFGAELRRAFQVVVCLTGSMSRFTFPPPTHTHTHFPFSAVSLSLSLWLFLFTHRHKAVWATQISAFACTRRISVAQGVTLQFWPWKVHRKWPGRAGGIIVTEERYNRSGSAMTERSPHAECVVLASRCVLFPLTEGQRSQSA